MKTINVTEKTGDLIAILGVDNDHDFMIINKSGITIRLRVEDLRVVGRATQGVKLINLRGKDEIAAICSVLKDDEDDTPTAEVVNEDMPTDGMEDTDDTTENDELSGEE